MKLSAENIAKIDRANGVDFYFTAAGAEHADSLVAGVLAAPQQDLVFKNNNRRLVYLHHAGDFDFVVKKYLPHQLKKQLRRKQPGFEEFAIHHKMELLGLNIPQIYGCFELQKWKLTKMSGVLLEYFAESRPLKSSEAELSLTLLAMLHRKGIYHADFMERNILINNQRELKLIDVENAQIVPPENITTTLLALRRYLEEVDFKNNNAAIRNFSTSAFHALQITEVPLANFCAAVEEMCKRHYSRAERKKSILPENIRQILFRAE